MSVIDDILQREGGGKVTNDPNDKGGRTQWGIAERSNPEAWRDGKVTEQEAREIYERKYVIAPGFNKIKDDHLREQLIDFGVNSGPGMAIMKLQNVLQVFPDGIIGPETLRAIDMVDPVKLNNKLMCERIKMIGRIVSKNHSQAVFISGWLNRAVEFLL